MLTLVEPVTDRSSLALASEEENQAFASGDDLREFSAFGYPVAAKGAGIRVIGEIYLWHAFDDEHQPALQLYSESVAAGMATRIHGFSGSPVLVDKKVVGHLWRIVEDPDPKNSGRPAFGLIYASPVAGLRQLLGGKATREVRPVDTSAGDGMLQMLDKLRSAEVPAQVIQLYSEWQRVGLPQSIGLAHAAQRLIELDMPEAALDLLKDGGDALRMRQLRALALDKAGRTEESLGILLKIKDEEGDLAESRGLLGGRYKQQWLKDRSKGKDFLIAAHDVYSESFKRTLDSYPGINAAATALYLGKPEECHRIASDIVNRLLSAPNQLANDKWLLATVAEGNLLLGKIDDARAWYRKAVAADPHATQAIDTMRGQAELDLNEMGKPPDSLKDAFDIPPA